MTATLNLEMSLAGKLHRAKLFDLDPGKEVESDKKKSGEASSDRWKQRNKVIVEKAPGRVKVITCRPNVARAETMKEKVQGSITKC